MNIHLKEYMKATGATSFYLFCIQLFHPLLSPYVKSLGFNDLQLGLVFGIFPLVLIFAAPIFGSISDHIGRKQVILFGIGCELVGITLYMFDTYAPIIYFARFFESLAYAAVIYSGIALMEDHVKNKVRGKYSGMSLTVMQAGQMVSPLIGGFMADYFIKLPFVLSMVLLLIMFIMMTFKNHKSEKHATIDDFRFLDKLKVFLSDRRLRGMAILGFIMHASIPLTFVYFPLFIIENFGLTFKYVGIATFVYTFFHLFQFVFGSLSDRFGQWRGVLFGTVMTGVTIGMLYFAHSYWVFIAILFVGGIGTACWNVSAIAYMSDIGEKLKLEGTTLGSYTSFAKMGSLISYVGSGFVTYYLGIDVLMLIIGSLIVVFSVIAYFFIRPQTTPQSLKHKVKH